MTTRRNKTLIGRPIAGCGYRRVKSGTACRNIHRHSLVGRNRGFRGLKDRAGRDDLGHINLLLSGRVPPPQAWHAGHYRSLGYLQSRQRPWWTLIPMRNSPRGTAPG